MAVHEDEIVEKVTLEHGKNRAEAKAAAEASLGDGEGTTKVPSSVPTTVVGPTSSGCSMRLAALERSVEAEAAQMCMGGSSNESLGPRPGISTAHQLD